MTIYIILLDGDGFCHTKNALRIGLFALLAPKHQTILLFASQLIVLTTTMPVLLNLRKNSFVSLVDLS